MATKIQCPHCKVPFPPRWSGAQFATSNPSRDGDEIVGTIYATSCMSCDKPILHFHPAKEGPIGETGRIPIFPVSKEQAIEIVIEISLDFEKLRRRHENEPEMTDDEQEEKANTLREKLNGMKDAVATEAYTRMTQGLSLLADTTQIIQLITGAR